MSKFVTRMMWMSSFFVAGASVYVAATLVREPYDPPPVPIGVGPAVNEEIVVTFVDPEGAKQTPGEVIAQDDGVSQRIRPDSTGTFRIPRRLKRVTASSPKGPRAFELPSERYTASVAFRLP